MTVSDPDQYRKAHPRVTEPSTPRLLSQRLRWLMVQKQKASTWWAEEVRKLILPAEQLEARVLRVMWQGLLAGIVIGLTLAWYVTKFGGV